MTNCELAVAGLIKPPPDSAFASEPQEEKPEKPVLNVPELRKFKVPEGEHYEAYNDPPLVIRFADSIGWSALAFNVAVVAFFFFLLFFGIRAKTANPLAYVSIPLIIVGISVIWNIGKFSTGVVKARRAKAYVDYVFGKPREIIVYLQGWYFTPITSGQQEDEIDFQRHDDASVEVGADGKLKQVEYRFTTIEGLEMFAKVSIINCLREGEEALSHSLKYPAIARNLLLRAVVGQRLSDLGGANSWIVMLACKGDVANDIALIFGKENEMSGIERDTGLKVKPPYLVEFGLTEESKKITNAKSEINIIDQGISKFRKHDVSPEEAAVTARVAAKVSTENIATIRGLPAGAKTVAFGDWGVGVLTSGN